MSGSLAGATIQRFSFVSAQLNVHALHDSFAQLVMMATMQQCLHKQPDMSDSEETSRHELSRLQSCEGMHNLHAAEGAEEQEAQHQEARNGMQNLHAAESAEWHDA